MTFDDFTYEKTPEKVKKYFINLLGASKARELMDAMRRRDWIIITGPQIATGKTTLFDILRSIGYTHVIEGYQTTTIQMDKPLRDLQEKSSIFEELGISWKH